jgi:hypothetical protein
MKKEYNKKMLHFWAGTPTWRPNAVDLRFKKNFIRAAMAMIFQGFS